MKLEKNVLIKIVLILWTPRKSLRDSQRPYLTTTGHRNKYEIIRHVSHPQRIGSLLKQNRGSPTRCWPKSKSLGPGD